MKKAVTIKEIAEELGLSRNTVSKALNGQYVPKKTRELVLRKARQMNYKSLDSEASRSQKHRILLLSGKPFHNMEFFVPLVQSIENHCYDLHYDFFEFTYNSKTTSFDSISKYILGLHIDGIIAIECFDPNFVIELLSLNVPTCFIDFPGYKFDSAKKYDLICSSDQKSVCESVRELHEKHKVRRFCFVGDHRHCLSFHERYMGMLRGIVKFNPTHPKEEDILDDDSSFDYGNISALEKRIMSLKVFPEVFVCCNDFVARNVATAVTKLGRKIPDEVMILGFDDVPKAVEESPTISTLAVNKDFIGEQAIGLLVSRIESKSSPTRTLFVNCEFKERESTRRK